MEDLRLRPAQAKAVGQGLRGEDIAGGLLGFLCDERQDAAISGFRSVRLAPLDAVALETGDHFVEADVFRATGQHVPAVGAARRVHQAGAPQRHQHLVQERPGDHLPARDLAALQGASPGVGRQLHDGADPVLGFHRQAHSHSGPLNS